MKLLEEPILVDPGNSRFTYFPVKYPDLHDFYDMQESAFWTSKEVPLDKDIADWEGLSDNERYFIRNVLAFFAASDGIVNENLAENFMREVMYPEAKAFYGIQIAIENIHSQMYSKLIEAYVLDPVEKDKCFNAIDHFPAVQKKATWALDWIGNDSFVDRMIAFVAVEGIFFSGSFCSIFWLKNKGLMEGLCGANELIFKDENLHCEFAIHVLNHHIVNKPTEKRIREIILSAVKIEKEFITESLPVSLIGMNSNMMKQYIEYVADQLLLQLGCSKEFNSEQPFKFMEGIAIESKGNFFEKKVNDYTKATIDTIVITDDF